MSIIRKIERALGLTEHHHRHRHHEPKAKRRTPPRKKNGEFRKRR